MKILLIEDDAKISKNVKFFLEQYKYIIDTSDSVSKSIEMLDENEYDIILLDWMLKDGEGSEILKYLSNKNSKTPILTITAKSMLGDKIEAFELGVDDYLVKPFMLPELLMRIKSIIRRSTSNTLQPNTTFFEFEIDMNKCEVRHNTELLNIKGKVYALLEYLILNLDRVVSRMEIEERVLDSSESDSNLVDVYIATLRKEFKKYSEEEIIKTVKGKGYMLCSN